jgi:hypothetical protein
MMQFKKSLKFLSLIFTIVILFSACGGGSSAQQTTEDNSSETTTPAETKVIATSNTEVEKLAEVAEEKKEEVKGKVTEEPVVEKPVVKKEVKKAPRKRAKMHFPEKVFDYGFIMQGDVVKHDFYFKNVGNADLVIKRVEPSCGCTVPVYPMESIAPGEDGKISVTFKSAGKLGRQVPSIKVFTNYRRSIKLELKGFVDAEREKTRQVVEEIKDTMQQ